MKRIRTFDESLPVPLTPAERLDRSVEMSRLMLQVTDREMKLKHAVQTEKTSINEVSVKIGRLRQITDDGVENRPIRCFEDHYQERNVAQVIREDTGEVVRERPLTINELENLRQAELPGVSARDTIKS